MILDEEIAKMLQYQDHNIKPKLQEIMDMEVALAVHKADQVFKRYFF